MQYDCGLSSHSAEYFACVPCGATATHLALYRRDSTTIASFTDLSASTAASRVGVTATLPKPPSRRGVLRCVAPLTPRRPFSVSQNAHVATVAECDVDDRRGAEDGVALALGSFAERVWRSRLRAPLATGTRIHVRPLCPRCSSCAEAPCAGWSGTDVTRVRLPGPRMTHGWCARVGTFALKKEKVPRSGGLS